MREITDATFETDVLGASKPVLVEFWAEWCGPCRAVGPVLEAIAADNVDKLDIVKVNADDNPETAAAYRVTGIPMMKLFSGGELVKTIVGAKPRPAIEAELAGIL